MLPCTLHGQRDNENKEDADHDYDPAGRADLYAPYAEAVQPWPAEAE
ncbi:hypothetical protein AB0D27_44240 [Streptomyces sp. NPDC048415]